MLIFNKNTDQEDGVWSQFSSCEQCIHSKNAHIIFCDKECSDNKFNALQINIRSIINHKIFAKLEGVLPSLSVKTSIAILANCLSNHLLLMMCMPTRNPNVGNKSYRFFSEAKIKSFSKAFTLIDISTALKETNLPNAAY